MQLRWLTDLFEETDSAALAAAAPSESVTAVGLPAKHVFMLGFPRSGTTLLEQVLDSHSAVVTSGERETLNEATREFLGTPAERQASLPPGRGGAASPSPRLLGERARAWH